MTQMTGAGGLHSGAAMADITPDRSVFLFGYPHVPRWSTGVHDPLTSSALFLRNGDARALIIANDLIFVGKPLARDVRQRIAARTGVPAESIVLTATHTHSGPITVDHVSNSHDPVVPKADAGYLRWLAERLVEVGCAAVAAAAPAEIGFAVARASGVGTNRHDPTGPADPEVPVLLVRSRGDKAPIACMLSYAMHTTVLHEDSTLISGDFPHFTREYLRTHGVVPARCPILYHNGASGNQSPRHVTRGNTFAEAQRLGELLGKSVVEALRSVKFESDAAIRTGTARVPLKPRDFGSLEKAREHARKTRARFDSLRAANAPRTEVRTAECDWFGAEESVALSEAAASGQLQKAVESCLPMEIVGIRIGAWRFAFWPGEFFVEYALEVRQRCPGAFVVTMTNGELQGYIVTPEAAARGVYESTNAIFAPENGRSVVDATVDLLHTLQR
jgi:neutral ceramidase